MTTQERMASLPSLPARQCFARARPARQLEERQALPVAATAQLTPDSVAQLPRQTAQALADTLPFLLCGEESAVHAFGRRWKGQSHRRAVLQAIASDELRHAEWLQGLAAVLPAPAWTPDTARMSEFFGSLLTREQARHFGCIAALDLSVCHILRPLARQDGVLALAPEVVAGLRSIRNDEARHVRVARDCALDAGLSAVEQQGLDAQVAQALTTLLDPVRSSLSQLGAWPS